MQRKPAFPLTKCNIKLPLRMITPPVDATSHGEDTEQKRQLLLINFGHSQWGFNNWSWAVSKQVLDFIDSANGIYTAGIVSFVTVTVKNLDIHREHIGYATATAPVKGTAIYQARKLSVTAGLRETLLSFGGSVTISLLELLGPPQTTDYTRADAPQPPNAPPDAQSPDNNQENNQNAPNKPADPKNGNKLQDFNPPRKDSVDGTGNPTTRSPHPAATPLLKNAVAQSPPPVAKALPMPANKPVNPSFPANQPRPQPPLPHQLPRPNPNEVPKAAPSLESMTDEEARAERKRRQRQAQEEFRQKQIMKQKTDAGQECFSSRMDGSPDADSDRLDRRSSFDSLLLHLPSQDIVIEETGCPAEGKRKSPEPGGAPKRRTLVSKLDIVTD